MTGEKDAGIILLENLLQARQQNPAAPIAIVYPEDGAILVPSPIAIMKTTAAPDAARRLYDFFLSDAGQAAIVSGWMYSPVDHIPPPPARGRGARCSPRRSCHGRSSTCAIRRRAREEIKRRFNAAVLDAR